MFSVRYAIVSAKYVMVSERYAIVSAKYVIVISMYAAGSRVKLQKGAWTFQQATLML